MTKTSQVPPLGRGERWLLGTVGTAGVGVGGLGFAASFAAVKSAAARWGFAVPWTLPVGIDGAVPVFTIAYLLLIRMDMTLGWVRFVPWALTSVTCWLNIAAGHSLSAKVAHGSMPLLWVVLSEIAAHVYAVRIGAVTGRRMEKIRRSRWVLAPLSTFVLWRRMTLWEITSYTDALARERQRQLARADLRERYGRRWRSKTPRRERVLLKLGDLAPTDTEPAREPARADTTAADTGVREPSKEAPGEAPATTPVSMEKPQATPHNPPPANTPASMSSRSGSRGRGVRHARAARTAAARTARTARTAAPEEKQSARAWVAEQVRAGRTPGWRDLAEHTGRGETWCRERIHEAEQDTARGQLDPTIEPETTAVPREAVAA